MNPHHPCFHDCHPIAEIPEPSTWFLVGIFLLVVFMIGYPRRRK